MSLEMTAVGGGAGLEAGSVRLVTRGDDAGSCESANAAILEACAAGVLRNVSIMVPGPAFEAAVELLRGLPVCLGLHVTLNAEWGAVKWGPVSRAEAVPSLVDLNGDFLESPTMMNERGFDADEVMLEVAAQLRRAREAGLLISYLDEHMGVSWLPSLRDRFAEFCRHENLVDARAVPSLPAAPAGTSASDPVDTWIKRIAAAGPGTYVLVTHPGLDAEDMRQLFHRGQAEKAGVVARERDAERRALCDPRFRRFCDDHRVALLPYTEAIG